MGRRGLCFAPVLCSGTSREWGRGPELEGSSERALPPLRIFGRFQTGERVLRASLQGPPLLLGRHHLRTSPLRSSKKFAFRNSHLAEQRLSTWQMYRPLELASLSAGLVSLRKGDSVPTKTSVLGGG